MHNENYLQMSSSNKYLAVIPLLMNSVLWELKQLKVHLTQLLWGLELLEVLAESYLIEVALVNDYVRRLGECL